jgi:hypothetical protein
VSSLFGLVIYLFLPNGNSATFSCAPRDRRAVTSIKVLRRTRTVKRTTTRVKTVATVTRTTTVATLAQRAINGEPLELEEATIPRKANLLYSRKIPAASSSNDQSTLHVEPRRFQARNLCARCPAGSTVRPYSLSAGRTSGDRFCCPRRVTITRTKRRTIRKTSVVTRRVSRTATITATFYAEVGLIGFLVQHERSRSQFLNHREFLQTRPKR